MPHLRHCLLAALGLLLAAAPADAQTYDATVNCQTVPTGHIDWPADDPVWSFDFVRPDSSSGIDGSGLELRNVYYRGYLVLKRAHTPVLNVEYDPGGCGCFRDWSYTEAGFATTGIRPRLGSCFADATPGTVRTTCDSNQAGGEGGDTGTFRGVAVEDLGDVLVVTTHMSAGWYRYRLKWYLYADGRIRPEYSFSAATAACTFHDHRHHVYFRFDFDLLEGQARGGEDQVYEVNPATGAVTRFTEEAQRTWGDPADGVFWAVRDAGRRAGYKIVPSPEDLALPVDPFSKLDMMAVRYEPGEVDDGSRSCAIDPDVPQLADGESLVGADVVVWYRSGALHEGGNPWACDVVGPTLVPFLRDGQGSPDARPTLEDFAHEGFLAAQTEAEATLAADGFELEGARPNPFDRTTTVRFRVAETQRVSLVLYDALGRRVATLHEGTADADAFVSVEVDGSSLPSGTYTVSLEGESVRGSTRVVLIR